MKSGTQTGAGSGHGTGTFIASYISCYGTLMIERAKKEASM